MFPDGHSSDLVNDKLLGLSLQDSPADIWGHWATANHSVGWAVGWMVANGPVRDPFSFSPVNELGRRTIRNRWGLFRNPLPPASERAVFRDIRNDAPLESKQVLGPRFDELGSDVRRDFLQEFGTLSASRSPSPRFPSNGTAAGSAIADLGDLPAQSYGGDCVD